MENNKNLSRPGNNISKSDIYKLQQDAKMYYTINKVPERMEIVLNTLFYDKPGDVYGYLSNYFQSFSLEPKILGVKTFKVLTEGSSALEVVLQTDFNNKSIDIEQSRTTVALPLGKNDEFLSSDNRNELLKQIIEETQIVEKLLSSNSDFLKTFTDISPFSQTTIDSKLSHFFATLQQQEEPDSKLLSDLNGSRGNSVPNSASPTKGKTKSAKGKNKGPPVVIIPDEPKEIVVGGASAASLVSECVCKSAASLKETPLFQYISSLNDSDSNILSVPVPLVSLIASGRGYHGKLSGVQEFLISPKPGRFSSMRESIDCISQIYHNISHSLMLKSGPTTFLSAKLVNDRGLLCPLIDRAEQGLDIIQEAIGQLNGHSLEDFDIVLDCGGKHSFDYEKGKYEIVAGTLKTPDDLADYFIDLTNRYPSVIGLIDPMRKQESAAWARLAEKISDHCYIIGDQMFPRPSKIDNKYVSGHAQVRASVATLRFNSLTTTTDILTASNLIHKADMCTLIETFGSGDSFLIDLAAAAGARFVRIGAPCRLENITKLNRLSEISDSITTRYPNASLSSHNFPSLKIPHVESPTCAESKDN